MGFRARLGAFLDRNDVRNGIIAVIMLNAVILGMETSSVLMDRFGGVIIAIDTACLAIFVAEIGAKLVARGWRFFGDGWNIFDFVIVGIALVPAAQGLLTPSPLGSIPRPWKQPSTGPSKNPGRKIPEKHVPW